MVRRTLFAILTLTIACMGMLLQPAHTRADAPISAAPRQYYLALGDSLSFGYQQAIFNAQTKATGTVDPTSMVGFVDYFNRFLHSINPQTQLVNVSCPGETTTSLINGGCDYAGKYPLHYAYTGSQLQAAVTFLKAHPGQVSPITLLIGPNDLIQLVHTCGDNLATGFSCIVQGLPGVLQTVQKNVATIVGTLRAAAPDAEIIIINSYNPYAAVSPATNALAAPQNQIFQGVATAFHTYFADIFTPFNLAQPQPQTICFLTNVCGPLQDIHATTYGYILIAQVLEQASGYLSVGAGVPLSARLYIPLGHIGRNGPMAQE